MNALRFYKVDRARISSIETVDRRKLLEFFFDRGDNPSIARDPRQIRLVIGDRADLARDEVGWVKYRR